MLDAISSVVSAVAAQSVTAKDEAQTKNTNTASKKQDAKTDKSDARLQASATRQLYMRNQTARMIQRILQRAQ